MVQKIGVLISFLCLICASPAVSAEIPKIANTYRHAENLYTSGQPRKGDFRALARAGVQVVVNMAPANLPASLKNEGEIVEGAGMEYHFIPVDWDHPTVDDVRQFFRVMDDSRGKTVLAHCWVNARSSGFVYLYRVLKQGRSEAEERAILESIWDHNQGYELRNVPVWKKFLASARQELRQ